MKKFLILFIVLLLPIISACENNQTTKSNTFKSSNLNNASQNQSIEQTNINNNDMQTSYDGIWYQERKKGDNASIKLDISKIFNEKAYKVELVGGYSQLAEFIVTFNQNGEAVVNQRVTKVNYEPSLISYQENGVSKIKFAIKKDDGSLSRTEVYIKQ